MDIKSNVYLHFLLYHYGYQYKQPLEHPIFNCVYSFKAKYTYVYMYII